jgi:hypothetical protein
MFNKGCFINYFCKIFVVEELLFEKYSSFTVLCKPIQSAGIETTSVQRAELSLIFHSYLLRETDVVSKISFLKRLQEDGQCPEQ